MRRPSKLQLPKSIGRRVFFAEDRSTEGTVVEIGFSCPLIAWDRDASNPKFQYWKDVVSIDTKGIGFG